MGEGTKKMRPIILVIYRGFDRIQDYNVATFKFHALNLKEIHLYHVGLVSAF